MGKFRAMNLIAIAAFPVSYCFTIPSNGRVQRKVQRLSSTLPITAPEIFQDPSYYEQKLCDEEEEADVCELPGDDDFAVAILGDLHFDPRKMDDYYKGREHFIPIIEVLKWKHSCFLELEPLVFQRGKL